MGLDILICVDDIPNQNLTQNVSNVEVHEKMDLNTSYKLSFAVDVCDGDIGQSIVDDTVPTKIISVLANVKDSLVCLVKGPVTRQQARLNHGGAGSLIHIEGEDTGLNLDRIPNFRITDSGTDAEIAMGIISTDNQMLADVESTPESLHAEDNHSHVQRESNLSLLRSLARRNGYHFWITYSSAGIATGHFKPRSLDGQPANTLMVNQENNNIDLFQVNADSNRPSTTEGRQVDMRTLEVMGGETSLDDTALGSSRLATLHGATQQSSHLAPVVDDMGSFTARSRGALREAQWFINATCNTSLHRLCDIVRFHTVVQVQGAGSRHSGKYYVTGVKHKIDAAAYIMELEMQRNAWGN